MVAFAVSLAAVAAVATARAAGSGMPFLTPEAPATFTLTSPGRTSETFTYAAPQGTRFAVVAAHSETGTVKLEYNAPGWEPNSTVGTNPGLSVAFGRDGSVRQYPHGAGSCNDNFIGWQPASNSTVVTVTVTLFNLYAMSKDYSTFVTLTVSPYSDFAPMPGGCCTTCLNANADASVVLRDKATFDTTIVLQQADLASVGWSWRTCPCDVVASPEYTPRLEYNLYFYFVGSCGSSWRRHVSPSSVRDGIAKMATVEGVLAHGTKLGGTPLLPTMLQEWFHIDTTSGQGVVYAVLVTDRGAAQTYPEKPSTTFVASYSPYPTFRCRLGGPASVNCSAIPSRLDCDMFPECVWEFEGVGGACVEDPNLESCDTLLDVPALVLTLVVGCAGLFIALFGHAYFVHQLFLDGALLGAMVTYVGVAYVTDPLTASRGAHVWFAVGGGVLGGALSVYWWFLSRGVALSLVVMGSVCGLVLTAFVFATPFGELKIWENSFNFGMGGVCGMLLPPIAMMLFDRVVTVAAAACTGSYFALLAVDFFVASSFDAIVVNVLRRLADPSFARDYSGNLFSTEFNGCSNVELNVAMLSAWVAMTVLCTWFQLRVSARLPDDAPRGSGGPPVSDRFDGQVCPTGCFNPKGYLPARRTRSRPRGRVGSEGWGNGDGSAYDARPLVEVSGSNGFRMGSSSSWGSWPWGRSSRRSSLVSPGSAAGSAAASPERRPLLMDPAAVGDGRASSRAHIYEDDLETSINGGPVFDHDSSDVSDGM